MATEARTPPNVIDIERVTLFTPAPGTEGERSSMNFCVYNGQPRITVWTRVPNDTDKGMINAAMNSLSMETLLGFMEKVIDGPNGSTERVGCEGNRYDPASKEKLPGRHHISTVVVGKDQEGVVWMSVVSAEEGRPKIQFKLGTVDWHFFQHKDGSRYTEAEMSCVVGKSMVRILREVYNRHIGLVNNEERQKRSEARKLRNEEFQARKGGGSGGGKPAVSRSNEFDDLSF